MQITRPQVNSIEDSIEDSIEGERGRAWLAAVR